MGNRKHSDMTMGNVAISWGIACLAGLIAFLLFRIMGDLSWSAAFFGGLAIAAILIILFTIIFGRELPPPGSVAAPTVARGSGATGGSARAGAASAPASTGGSAPNATEAASVASGAAGMGGGSAAATAPAATGTPTGEGAASAEDRRAAEAASTAAVAEAPVAATPESPAAAPPSAEASAAAAVPEGSETKPATLDAPRDGGADDLKRIKGVGPKLEKLCNALGFWHFDQIAGWTPAEIAWVDRNLEGFKGRVTRDEWVAQAKALAAGEETEFSKRVDKGGVY
ncbi:NADH:ubiquinone oxidoreductase [Jannaschia marina]|uniref:NADH:ubiquinone oxidoreductase n=1 Tax=Jannaschia marina TaxID=2741674 RepID=UPI001F478E97|nr:NADH:ubiquinone oxidoreductase [Jannaschia marina]